MRNDSSVRIPASSTTSVFIPYSPLSESVIVESPTSYYEDPALLVLRPPSLRTHVQSICAAVYQAPRYPSTLLRVFLWCFVVGVVSSSVYLSLGSLTACGEKSFNLLSHPGAAATVLGTAVSAVPIALISTMHHVERKATIKATHTQPAHPVPSYSSLSPKPETLHSYTLSWIKLALEAGTASAVVAAFAPALGASILSRDKVCALDALATGVVGFVAVAVLVTFAVI